MSASIPFSIRKRRREPILCSHCNRLVSHTTFYRHKATFYDPISNIWDTNKGDESNSDSEIEVAHESDIECSSLAENPRSADCK